MDLPPWRPAEAPGAAAELPGAPLYPSLRLLRAPQAGAGLLDRIMNESDGEDEDEDTADDSGPQPGDSDEDDGVAGVSDAVFDFMARAAEGVRHAARGAPQPLLGVIQPSQLAPWGVDVRQQRAQQPPEEIDLTLSDEEGDETPPTYTSGRPASALGTLALTDGEEARSGGEEDEDVQIIGSTGATSVVPVNPRRKRRRPSTETQLTTKSGFDPNAAESTAVSLENADLVEQLKRALKCSICLDHIKDMTSTMCGHVFCARCITAQVRINAKCPLCQRRLQLKDIHPLFF